MFATYILKLEDAAQEVGITDRYKRWLIETAYSKLIKLCSKTKETVMLGTDECIKEDRSEGKWIALKWVGLVKHAVDVMTYEECEKYTKQIMPQELASVVVSKNVAKDLEESADEALDGNLMPDDKKKKAAGGKKKQLAAPTVTTGGQNGVVLSKIGTPHKQRLCVEELAAQLDVLENGNVVKCKSASACRFEHVVKGQPKAWVANQIATCNATLMISGGVATPLANALAMAVTADVKKLFK